MDKCSYFLVFTWRSQAAWNLKVGESPKLRVGKLYFCSTAYLHHKALFYNDKLKFQTKPVFFNEYWLLPSETHHCSLKPWRYRRKEWRVVIIRFVDRIWLLEFRWYFRQVVTSYLALELIMTYLNFYFVPSWKAHKYHLRILWATAWSIGFKIIHQIVV